MENNYQLKQSKWQPVPMRSVNIDDIFWSPKMKVNRERTLKYEYEQCKETGRIDAFRLDWQVGKEPKPHIFWDSDVAKWVEAASFSLLSHYDAELAGQLDEVVNLIISAQQPDGYLNVYFTVVEPERRWTNLMYDHELYCAGHLMEAAVAHFEATGQTRLLKAMCQYADYIDTVFGVGEGKRRGYCGHEEIELALVKLYKATKVEKYLRLAQYFVDERGRMPSYFDQEKAALGQQIDGQPGNYDYCQAHKSVREQTEVVGHAVRAMYLYCAMADLAQELADDSLRRTCETLWDHLCNKRLYVTGGLGSSRHNEGFTSDYDLPNETAYAETCAAIGLVMWAQRMLQLDCDSRYADQMERALYNGVISGVSLSGDKFFYENPLASKGRHHRQGWYHCSCCPPNIARLLPSLGHYVYSASDSEIAVHLYIGGRLEVNVLSMPGGEAVDKSETVSVALEQKHNYPWNGNISLAVTPERPARFGIRLRLPNWCREASLFINGNGVEPIFERGYAVIYREWMKGDRIEWNISMPVERVYSHPSVAANRGRVALQRGPIVYCLEQTDNGDELDTIVLSAEADLKASYDQELMGGVTVIYAEAERLGNAVGMGGHTVAVKEFAQQHNPLYRWQRPERTSVKLRAIPYAYWNNREAGEMIVWMRERENQ